MQPEGISDALWVESRSDVIIPITFCRIRISAFHAVIAPWVRVTTLPLVKE
jgi:hypothetical protein